VYVTPAVLDDQWMVRVSVGAELTEREHVEAGWKAIRDAAEAGAQGSRG
jgi:aromatic-L-amino-acid decarboxylase